MRKKQESTGKTSASLKILRKDALKLLGRKDGMGCDTQCERAFLNEAGGKLKEGESRKVKCI